MKTRKRYINPATAYRVGCVFLCAALLISAVPAYAQLHELSDADMKKTTAQSGLTTFTMSNNTAQLFIDIHIETYATINTLAAGYYDNSVNGKGWDHNWKGIKLGDSASSPLTVDGLLLIANFDDVNSANRKLERIVFGSNRLQGTLSADMQSYTGMYNPALVGGSGSPVTVTPRTNLGQQTFAFNSNGSQTSGQGLFFILSMDGSHPAVQVVAGYDSKSLSATTMTTGVWWKSP